LKNRKLQGLVLWILLYKAARLASLS